MWDSIFQPNVRVPQRRPSMAAMPSSGRPGPQATAKPAFRQGYLTQRQMMYWTPTTPPLQGLGLNVSGALRTAQQAVTSAGQAVTRATAPRKPAGPGIAVRPAADLVVAPAVEPRPPPGVDVPSSLPGPGAGGGMSTPVKLALGAAAVFVLLRVLKGRKAA